MTSVTEWVPLAEVLPWDRNPRHNDGAPVTKVAASIRRFGFIAPVVVWRSKRQLVAGHTRLKALQAILAEEPTYVPRGAPGPGLVLVRYHEFANADEAAAYAIADNRLNEEADWDYANLAGILRDMNEDDRLAAGFDVHELEPLLQATWGPGVPSDVDPGGFGGGGDKPRTISFDEPQWAHLTKVLGEEPTAAGIVAAVRKPTKKR